ncbi:hypothetical protein F5Y16DRAFT_177090 [Xylariaceae sp. FL0255]|nr:hypothetical protein F5Y16DRAFT_177090 [Xylariaceae sp. FL0255]
MAQAEEKIVVELTTEGADPDESSAPPRFPPEEEAALLNESQEKKTEANALFASARYESAITKYEEATAICPHYLDYEIAVLKSNIAACQLKLEEWKDAVKSATEALEGLARLEKSEAEAEKQNETAKSEEGKVEEKDKEDEEEAEEEIISTGAQKSAPAPPKPVTDPEEEARQKRRDDIERIRAKALMRRARARSELAGWSNLSGAEEDYKTLNGLKNLGPADRKIVAAQLRALPPRVKAAQEAEMAEMWGKLKDLGNGILKPFGLSTDNFNMVKDEKTGGYSMNFNQNPQGGK